MTKKKSPISSTKKSTPKKATPTAKWIKTAEANIPGLGIVKEFDVTLPEETGNRLLEALLQENKMLKERLNPQPKEMSQPMQTADPTLDNLLGEMNKQLSRYYNGLNTLDQFSDRLKTSPLTATQGGQETVAPSDIFGKLDSMLQTFNYLNNRLEGTNGYMGEII